MAVPGGLLFGKLLYPTVEPSRVVVDGRLRRQAGRQRDRGGGVRRVGRAADRDQRRRDADRVRGAIALMNLIVGGVAAFAGFPQITLVGIIGHLFAPLAWIIGVPWHDAALAGNFIGEKLIFNEFVAYGDLSPYLKGGAHVAAAGLQVLDPKTLAIVSFALCGFANFSSIAILAGGFSAVAPERRSEVARHGLRALTAATLSNLMSAAIAGLFFSCIGRSGHRPIEERQRCFTAGIHSPEARRAAARSRRDRRVRARRDRRQRDRGGGRVRDGRVFQRPEHRRARRADARAARFGRRARLARAGSRRAGDRQAFDRWRRRCRVADARADGGRVRRLRADDLGAWSRPHRRHARQAQRDSGLQRGARHGRVSPHGARCRRCDHRADRAAGAGRHAHLCDSRRDGDRRVGRDDYRVDPVEEARGRADEP